MKPWQLYVALVCGRVSRIEVVALRCCGYQVRALLSSGRYRTVSYAEDRVLWPSMGVIKARLQRYGVRQLLLLQPESHDEIIGRPALREADPGLWLAVR